MATPLAPRISVMRHLGRMRYDCFGRRSVALTYRFHVFGSLYKKWDVHQRLAPVAHRHTDGSPVRPTINLIITAPEPGPRALAEAAKHF
jgi:hypothetical protein